MQAGLPMTASQSFFADANGMTLYTYGGDADGKSACAGDCAQAWPALTAPGDAKPVGDWTVPQGLSVFSWLTNHDFTTTAGQS